MQAVKDKARIKPGLVFSGLLPRLRSRLRRNSILSSGKAAWFGAAGRPGTYIRSFYTTTGKGRNHSLRPGISALGTGNLQFLLQNPMDHLKSMRAL